MRNAKTPIIYLANAGSPHVRHWIEYLNDLNLPYHIYSIHQNKLFPKKNVTVKFCYLNKFGAIGSIIAYLLLGIWLRLKSNIPRNIHAHNTSGYGFSALVSGYKYIITTYGSEIFGAKGKSILYRMLINKILKNSSKITASSPVMTLALQEQFNVPTKDILTFCMGVSPIFKYSIETENSMRIDLGIDQNAYVWIYNRRILPLYNTLNVVDAFKVFLNKNPSLDAYLILIEGIYDASYLEQVKEKISSINRIKLVAGFINQSTLNKYLCVSNAALSLPRSDQLSSSILESISCGCLPVLLNLPAYEAIRNGCVHTTVPGFQVEDIVGGFTESCHTIMHTSQLREKVLQFFNTSGWDRIGVSKQLTELYHPNNIVHE